MKIKVKASELTKKMQRALGVIQLKAMIPVLSFVKITVMPDGKQAIISGSDLGMSMIQSVDISLQEGTAGSLLLPAKTVSEQLANFASDSEVTIESDGQTTTLQSSNPKFKTKLPSALLSAFPVIEQKPETQFSIKTAALRTIIDRVEFAAPSKGGRLTVPSVLLESTTSRLRGAATDGHRIAVADVEGSGAGDFTIQLPKTILGLLKDLPGDTIAFAQSETNLFFQGSGEQVLVRKPVTAFPPYQRAFKQTYSTSFQIPVPTLQTALSLASSVVDKANPAVDLLVENGILTVKANSLSGESEQDIIVTPHPTLNAPNKLRMNTKYAQEFLSLAQDSVTFELSGERSLAKFSSASGDYQYFVMPMQQPTAKTEEAPAAKA